ncbi:SHOCT domain-containing protein [Diaminobutyricimonas sp. LJ205]|uniref:SHOCT domain-containing protein n=1 Tax=Diaminobutyricimonas sp. LJ205 TaxID=2683590 RepID=UPI0018DFECF0|nr:SHOCT domain-containing protein [Diaminobutyricimonas sp. LJ205]
MTDFSVKWNPKKAAKKMAVVQTALFPGEDVWFLGFCNNLKPLASEIALTALRVVALQEREIKFEARYPDIASFVTNAKKGTVEVVRRDGGSIVIKMVPQDDLDVIEGFFRLGQRTTPPSSLMATADTAAATNAASLKRITAAKESSWPNSILKGKLSRKASEAILRQCHGDEQPWLILTSSAGAGILASFDDRLVIIKTGAFTSFMAGSLGGERSATFHFSDITGIEYNSGFVNGVLEILTPSYSGGANKDYWRGTNQSRNADSNDPWTLSNCLPLSKLDYNTSLAEINELKARVSRAKQMSAGPVAPKAAPEVDGLAEQLQKLAGLRDSGVLSDEEFTAAKARLLA